MSRGGRRGAPPDLKGTLGTLIRTTINQVGAMTDVARRQARSQKQRLDTALLERRRSEALTELGEILYELVSSGEIELTELPELDQAASEVAEIDRRIAELAVAVRPQGKEKSSVRRWRTTGARPEGRAEQSRVRVWRPDRAADSEAALRSGTQRTATPNEQVETSSDPVTELPGQNHPAGESALSSHVSRAASSGRGAQGGGGGIVFVDDDSAPAEIDPDDRLESYMNEEDLPRRR